MEGQKGKGGHEEGVAVLAIDAFTREIEAYADWYRSALGLSDYRFEIRGERHDSDDKSAGSAFANDQYPTAVIRIREHVPDDATWRHHRHEETTVHELIHVVLEPMLRFVEQLIDDGKFGGRARPVIRAEFERYFENAIERFSWAMVACAHADRDGTPPVVGAFMPRTDL